MSKIEIDLDLITQRYDELKDLIARCKFEQKQAEKEMEKLELQFVALLNQSGVKEMNYKCYNFGMKITQRTALDQKYLKEHYADIAEKCTFTKEKESFEFKINK